MFGGSSADGSLVDVMDKWGDKGKNEGIDNDCLEVLVHPSLGRPMKITILDEDKLEHLLGHPHLTGGSFKDKSGDACF